MEAKLKRINKKDALMEIPNQVGEYSVNLAARVKKELGYDILHSNVTMRTSARDRALAANKVIEALDAIGIELLVGVNRYMDEVRREVSIKTKKVWSWRDRHITNFSGIIPEFALERALQIRETLKTTELQEPTFYVSALEEEDRYTGPSNDPFLYFTVSECGDLRFYTDVWDEPKFEGRRTI